MNTQEPDLRKIRVLLSEGFSTEDLLNFCFDHALFRALYDNWSRVRPRDDLIREIIDLAHRKLVIDELIDYVAKHNPERYELHKPYYREVALRSAQDTVNVQYSAALENNHIGYGVILGGMYQGCSMQIVAGNWCAYGSFGLVRSGWFFIPQLSVDHALAFFKVHRRNDQTGYLHIVDVSDPPHTITLSIPEFNFIRKGLFDFKNHASDLWTFQWPE